jgi:hypothetical protein
MEVGTQVPFLRPYNAPPGELDSSPLLCVCYGRRGGSLFAVSLSLCLRRTLYLCATSHAYTQAHTRRQVPLLPAPCHLLSSLSSHVLQSDVSQAHNRVLPFPCLSVSSAPFGILPFSAVRRGLVIRFPVSPRVGSCAGLYACVCVGGATLLPLSGLSFGMENVRR